MMSAVEKAPACIPVMDFLDSLPSAIPAELVTELMSRRSPLITSNDRSLGCPIIHTDTNSQCLYTPQQCLSQQCSFTNRAAMFDDNSNGVQRIIRKFPYNQKTVTVTRSGSSENW